MPGENEQDQSRRASAAELLAKLASTRKLDPGRHRELVLGLKRVMPTPALRSRLSKVRFKPVVIWNPRFAESDPHLKRKEQFEALQQKALWTLEAQEPDELEYRRLFQILDELHWMAHHSINSFLDRRPTVIPLTPLVTLASDDRTVHERIGLPSFVSGDDLWLFELLRESPARFGRCFCGVVFAHKRRGRRRRFCSPRCASKGIPSAANRTRYVQEYRRRQRRQELDNAKKVLRGVRLELQIVKLKEAFPKKSDRALRFLLKKIGQKRNKQPDRPPSVEEHSTSTKTFGEE
jgi:hypothetical protein